ncbi:MULTISPECIES: hypothetical protein [unclassified Sphingomonas]|uniref:hypothetical protein n=1 Tax=unclassified Sphingomonas TaxID=196159 RepID=UPI0007005EAE|nr:MULTISPECIES: hypothetical protein [unclassified Sphingomonas]KQX18428.1 hypothetical protein ASD17_14800 [Sphingomonas sp. Root1294]KQY72247.1 hypothetical protein ASD39_20175 [Sphingomonas sp. Root50]KRB94482.1 hypothetical protein ASE22_00575 [Sphingomonas sp. Root720]
MSASQIRAAVEAAFRDFTVDGVPSSGAHDPIKVEIRYALGQLLETALSSISSGLLRYATVSAMEAVTDKDDGQLAYVYANNADPADSENGVYQWDDGGSEWVVADWYYAAVVAAVQAQIPPDDVVVTVLPYKELPPSGSNLLRVHSIKLLPSITLPTDPLYVRYLFRDHGGAGGAERTQFIISKWTGSAVDLIGLAGSGANVNTGGSTGLVEMDLKAASGTAFAGVANDQKIGTLTIDFKDGADFTAGTLSVATSELEPLRLQMPAGDQDAVEEKVSDALDDLSLSKVPFAQEVTAIPIRKLVKSMWLYGADPTHDYAISVLTVETFTTPSTRLRITVRDLTDGVDVCSVLKGVASQPGFATFVATLPDIVKVMGDGATPKTRLYCLMEFDWTAVSDFFSYGSATMAGAGISPERLVSDEMIADYLDSDHWHEVIRVGDGETYETLRDAVESTYSAIYVGSDINGAPICDRAHYHHRILIDVVDDATFDATFLKLPSFVDLRCNGIDRTLIVRENTDPDAMIEAHKNHKIRDCTIYSETAGEYCIHSDDANRDVLDGTGQYIRLRQSFKRVKLQGAIGHNGPLFGSGISSGEEIRFEDCIGEHLDPTATQAAFFFHNNGPTSTAPTVEVGTKPAQVTMRGTSSPDQLGVILQTIDPSAICSLTLIGCEFRLIRLDIATGGEVRTDLVSDRNAWRIGGRHDGAFQMFDPVGATVLKTTAGEEPSGDAAALIFGAVDELGRGEKWIGDGDFTLGKRLGDCSSVTKTLTIDGQDCVFSTDLTNASNATIVSAINAAITSNPVSIVDIALEWVPDAAPKRRVRNSSGATIAKGRFVRFSGASTIVACAAGERPDGWTHRDMLDGSDGYVILTKRVHQDYIPGASAGTGEWGVSAGGVIDYAAATKLGRTMGSIVTVY